MAILAGCSQQVDAPATDTPPWAALVDDLRFRWSASPGIDLSAYPAAALRAYIESFELASITQTEDVMYPGFLQATRENQARTGNFLTQLVGIRPLPPPYEVKAKEVAGYFAFHLLDLTPDASGWVATICRGSYAAYSPSDVRPGKFASIASIADTATPAPAIQYPGVGVLRVQLTDENSATRNAPRTNTPQKGPATRPYDDVFGPWLITASSSGSWGPIDDPSSRQFPEASLVRQCSDTMPDDAAKRRTLVDGFKDAPPDPGSAIPGWPAKPE